MKLSEFITDVGRPIAYYPGLRKLTGSTTATILLCQLMYWTGKEKAGDGWIYKTAEELEEETGLSYDEQKTARAKLVDAGILQENYKRLEHKMFYRVDTDCLNRLWETPEHGNPQFGNMATPSSSNAVLPSSLIGNTENTKEYKHMAQAPEEKHYPLEWQIASGAEKIVIPTEEQEFINKIDIACMNICHHGADLDNLARAFMTTRRLLPGKRDIKGWALALREMKEQKVTPDILRLTIQELSEKGLTIADPFSVKKTAISKANPMTAEAAPAVNNGVFYG